MSSSVSDERLTKAFRLIEADELGAARAILQPLLAEDPDNADAWWLYVHAVTDPAEARRALDHVLRLDPDYPGAADLSRALEAIPAAPSEPAVLYPEPVELPTLASEGGDWPDLDDTLPELTEEDERHLEELLEAERDEEDEEFMATQPEPEERRTSPLVLLVALIVIVLIVGVASVLFMQSRAPAVTPTPSPALIVGANPTATPLAIDMIPLTEEATEAAIAAVPTSLPTEEEVVAQRATEEATVEEPTVEPTIAPTTEPTTEVPTPTEPPTQAPTVTAMIQQLPPTLETVGTPGETQPEPLAPESTDVVLEQPEGNEYSGITTALAGFTMPEDGIGTAQTELGNTLLVTVCSAAGQQLRMSLPPVMELVATQVNTLAPDVQAVGARMFNCDTNRLVLIVAVPREEAMRFAEGSLSAKAFQQFWRPQ